MNQFQSINDLFKETPHIRLAKLEDNSKILDFYHQTEMKGSDQSIKYGRGNDFFYFLKERCPDNLVFTLWGDNEKLEGVAVVSYRSGFVNGKEEIIGYMGDLRVNLNKKLIREWRHMFSLFIKYSPYLLETKFCKFYQTVIIDSNHKARASLVNTQIKNLKYSELENYKMVNIIGRIRFFRRNNFKIDRAQKSDYENLKTFLQVHDCLRNFGRNWQFELDYRLNNWKSFDLNNFLIIRDNKNQIVAVTSIWNPIKTKQVITTSVPMIFKMVVPILNLLPFVQIKDLPKANTPIEILYLNQFVFEKNLPTSIKKYILGETIDSIFAENFSMLAYCDFSSQNLLKDNLCFIKHQIKMTMFSVHYLDDEGIIRDQISINKKIDPGFDMALV